MTGCLVGQYSPADLQAMTNAEVLSVIERDIYENAYGRQEKKPIRFRGKDLAEHIETVLYLCPRCHSIGTIHSQGNDFFCTCGLYATYTDTGFLAGEALPFATITAWDNWQAEQLALLAKGAGEKPICTDDNQRLWRVCSARSSALVGEGQLQMSLQELRCAGRVFPLAQITRLIIVDQMTLQFSLKDGTHYEIHSSTPRSATKYLEILRVARVVYNA